MSAAAKKRARPAALVKPLAPRSAPPVVAKPARASQLRAQTRKLLGKHYRAKYGVR